jgi:hypothetical protein
MNVYPVTETRMRTALSFLALAIFLAGGCASTKVKNYQVEIRVSASAKVTRAMRAKLVLRVADDLQDPNLSLSEEYILRGKKPHTAVLLDATEARMLAAGIEPLEEGEARLSSGRLLVILSRLEVTIQNRMWLASAELRGESYSKSGRLVREWKAIGRGTHPDSRVSAGGAGLAMGKAISQALDKFPWNEIAGERPTAARPKRSKLPNRPKRPNLPTRPKRR